MRAYAHTIARVIQHGRIRAPASARKERIYTKNAVSERGRAYLLRLRPRCRAHTLDAPARRPGSGASWSAKVRAPPKQEDAISPRPAFVELVNLPNAQASLVWIWELPSICIWRHDLAHLPAPHMAHFCFPLLLDNKKKSLASLTYLACLEGYTTL